MCKQAAIRELEAVVGHEFLKPGLLVCALTHRSMARQMAQEADEDAATVGKPARAGDAGVSAATQDNERLEFLGDAVLNLVVAEALFEAHPEWHEGELTRVRARLVSRQHMAQVAEAIGLGGHLRLSKGEEHSGLRRKSTVLSDSMEAVMGALFLDGGLDPVRAFVGARVMGEAAEQLARELRSGAALGNYKSALQERLQASRAGTPVYRLKSESGPPHRRQFFIEVRIKGESDGAGEPLARGTGNTKKRAEQDAARHALERLEAAEANLPGGAVLEPDREEAAAQ